MNHSQALLKLLEALNHVGIDQEKIDIKESETDVVVSFNLLPGASIKVTVTDFWRYPTISCYFVNFSHFCGDLMACQGTPYIERAIFDLGQAIEAANRTHTRIQGS